jgi:hypothetical protein
MNRRLLLLLAALPGSILSFDLALAGSRDLLNGSVAIPAATYQTYTFTIDGRGMLNPRVSGRLTASGGTGNDIEVYVLSDADLVNWKNGHDARTFFNSGRVTVADVHARLPDSGTYTVVVSNTFSAFTPKTVEGRLTLTWDEPSFAQSATETAVGGTVKGLVMWLLILVLCAAALGGFIAYAILAAKKKQTPPVA